MTTPKAGPTITKVPQDLPLDKRILHIGKMNGMLAAQAAAQREANIENQVSDIAEANKEIARRKEALAEKKAAFDKEARENLKNLDDRAKAAGVLDNSGRVISSLNKQTSKTSDTGTQANKPQVEVSNLLNNLGENASVAKKQPGNDGTSAKAVAQKVDNAAVNANLPKENQAQENKALDQSKETRAKRQKAFAEKQEARIARAHQNAEIIYKTAEALAGRVYKKLGELNAKLDTLNTQEDPSLDEKARAEKIRQKIEKIEKKANDLGLLDNPEINAALAEKIRQRIERIEKKANDLGLLDNPEKNPALAEKAHKKLGALNAELEVINKQQAKAQESSKEGKGLFSKVIQIVKRMFRNVPSEEIKDVTPAKEAHQNPARPNKPQTQAPDLSKNSGKTESQESLKEGKGLFSKVIQIVKKMFRNKLAEEINDYRAENKDHRVVVQRESDYDTSFVRINKQEFKLEPGKDFNYRNTGINICITYENNGLEQQAPNVLMNIKINGEEHNIQPGKIWRYDNHGLAVDVVRNRNIDQNQEVARKDVANVKAEALEHGTVLSVEGVENVQAEALKDIKPPKTPTKTEKNGGEFYMKL